MALDETAVNLQNKKQDRAEELRQAKAEREASKHQMEAMKALMDREGHRLLEENRQSTPFKGVMSLEMTPVCQDNLLKDFCTLVKLSNLSSLEAGDLLQLTRNNVNEELRGRLME
jgi:hypothetical protein